MRLRSGFTYNYKPSVRKINTKSRIDLDSYIKNELLKQSCDICKCEYKHKNKVVSCTQDNILKHNFHSNCLQQHIKANLYQFYSSGHFNCPYCLVRLNKFNLGKIYL